MKEQWIDNLRRQADGYSRKAPDGLLDDIKKEMSLRGLHAPEPRRKRSRVVALWTGRAAVAAAAVAAALVMMHTGHEADTTSPAGQTLAKASGQAPNRPPQPAGEAEGSLAEAAKSVARLLDRMTSPVASTANAIAEKLSEPMGEPADSVAGSSESRPSTPTEVKQQPKQAQQATRPAQRQTHYEPLVAMSDRSESHGLHFSAGFSGMGNGKGNEGNAVMLAQNDAVYTFKPIVLADAPMAVTDMTTHADHDVPLKVGVSVRYDLGRRWSLSTGVNYSYLSSNITRSNNVEESHSRQRLHYVSIPVGASYSVWSGGKFNVYVGAGAEAAKLVSGKAKVERTEYGKGITESKESVSEHRLQYSVSGMAGIEYGLGSGLSLYAEPGVTHYFNNHSDVVNIYKDKPTQLTINVGLRLNVK